jgi:V/A-type H+/Na+-transporting ATPase subunit E
MEQKIRELTQKIFQEGVEKGEAQARKIVAEAQEKAANIIAEAQARAEKNIADARQQALEMKRNTESEIKLAGAQALSAIKQQVLDLITAKMIDGNMTAAFSDPATIKEFVAIIIHNWKTGSETPRLELLLPAQKQDELRKAFEKGASDLMKKGLTLSFSKSIKAGFRIGPCNGVFKISCTDEDFAEFMKEYLRPKTRAYLFGA